ncbi:MAG: cobalt-precorrin 5A hydrolase [Halanaerobiaceae bacterium]
MKEKEKEKIAVITLSRRGQDLATKLEDLFNDLDIYCKDKYRLDSNEVKGIEYYNSSVKELTAILFKEYKNIIYIMALGIVVRVIAPYLKSKKEDPAVVTIDESGRNVISTLSGHLGGANQLTTEIADILKANSVITTATDCQGKPAIDMLAKEMNCIIEPFKNLKLANAAIVNDRPLSIFTDYTLDISESKYISVYPLSDFFSVSQSGFPVIVSNKEIKINGDYLQLIPRNIVVGIGCRRGISAEEISSVVQGSLQSLNLSEKSIKKIATIDLKKDEIGLLEYAAQKSLEMEIIDREEINNTNLDISQSDFVQKMIGVPGVCEPAALLASDSGKLILPKTKCGRITIAVVEENLIYEEEEASNG